VPPHHRTAPSPPTPPQRNHASPRLSTDFCNKIGPERIIILVLDNAGWHTQGGLAVPEGIRLLYLPPYTPELQPVETLWVHVDEPIVNRHFETLADLDAVVARQCIVLSDDTQRVKSQAGFHWWPK
jgi:transposase